METFNRHMMTLAREMRGITQSSLAKSLSVGQGTVSKYEAGLATPPDEFVSDLSEVLGFKLSLFYETGRPYGMPPFHYRKRKKLSAKALAKILAEMNLRRMHVAKLLRSYEAKSTSIPEIDRDEYIGKSRRPFSVEEVASHIRELWGLPPGPVPDLIELIERMGGVVIPCDFGTDLLDAMSQRIDGFPVLFFVNTNAPADRMRHTLAHELGHVILHTTFPVSDEEMEAEADEFAGAFLLPAKEIRPQLRRFSMRQLANMKRYWGVSMQAIAVRAERLGYISSYQLRKFFIELGQRGWRKREPNEPDKEKPTLLRTMIDFHLQKLGYSKEDLAELLGLHGPELEEMYGPQYFDLQKGSGPHLELVN